MADLTITRRNLPHWTLEGAWYYVTFCVKVGTLTDSEKSLVLDHIKQRGVSHCRLIAVSVMPDHVHIILRPHDGQTISRVLRLIKGTSSRLVNEMRGTYGPLWQAESWDRIIRDDQEFQQKIRYILQNPVEEKLIEDPWAYPWWCLEE